ncbi:KR domain-containing protein [Daldinia sp. FL1419]|nr:KR domain-containing protein [Daldinia sp. FL1419]
MSYVTGAGILGEPRVDTGAATTTLTKLGSYPRWDIDVENSMDAIQDLLGRVYDSVPQAEYSKTRELEWAAYIICKKVFREYNANDAANLAVHYRRYYHYAKRQLTLAEEGGLICQSPEWTLANEATEDMVLARVAKETAEGEVMRRINDRIRDIFEGKVEASGIIDIENLPETIYRTGVDYKRIAAIQCQYIKHLSHKKPLSILELGARTGSVASGILSGLGQDVAGRLRKYTYTDANEAFLPEAKEELKQWAPMMEYKILDIEKDPLEQGIAGKSYDLIISFQALHITSSIDTVLQNCKKLLKPGGKLIVTDLTNKIARHSVVFGILPDWWLGGKDGRRQGLELSEEEWDLRLRSQGYSGIEWCFRDQENPGYSSSILATSISHTPYTPMNQLKSKVAIITPPTGNIQTRSMIQQISDGLAKDGISLEEVPLVDIGTLELSATHCIVCYEVEKPFLSSMRPDEFDALQRVVLCSKGILWITRGGCILDMRVPEFNMVTGLARTIRAEAPNVKFTTLDLDPDVPCGDPGVATSILQVLRLQIEQNDTETEFAKRNGALYVPRICPSEALSSLMAKADSHETPTELVDFRLSSNATYIVPGGTGGLGRALLMRMAKRGARNLVTTSRSGAKDPRSQKLLQELFALGVRVKVFTADVGCAKQCRDVLDNLAKENFPPIRGAVIMSMALKNEMFGDMDFESWTTTLHSKHNVTSNMHHMLPKDLDFFISVSSLAGIIGLVTQTNYGAGCTYQDAIAHYRRAQGLKATTIDLGYMSVIGYAAENWGMPKLFRSGARELTENQFMAVVEAAMADRVETQPIIGMISGGLVQSERHDLPYWFASPLFGPQSVYDTQTSIPIEPLDGGKENTTPDLPSMLHVATNIDDITDIVCSALTDRLSKNLYVNSKDVDSNRSVQAYEINLFMAFDLRNWAFSELKSLVPIPEILKDVPLKELAKTIALKSKLVQVAF